jgi:PAS domain S-box-containing protein
MKPGLRVLHLEDDPRDAELVRETLETDHIVCEVTRVETQADFVESLEQQDFDLILADYTLPSFDGLSALKVARQRWPDVPFIFVAGTLGEDLAIQQLKVGATDYVLKTRLSGLVPSVRRALREANERAELDRAEKALRRSEAYLAEAQHLSHTGSFGWHVSTGEIYWSCETFRIFEFDPSTPPAIERVLERTHPEDRQAVQQLIERVSRERKDFDIEHRLLMPDKSIKHLRVVGRASTDDAGDFEFVGAVTDITERKRAEALFIGEKHVLEKIATGAELKEILNTLCLIIEEYLRGTFASVLLLSPDGIHLNLVAGPNLPASWIEQMEKLPIGPCAGSCGTAAYRKSPVLVSEIATDPLWDIPEHRASALRHGLQASWSNPVLSSDGQVLGTFCIYCREARIPDSDDLGVMEMATHLARVAIEHGRAEEALRTSEQKYRDLINTSPDAIYVIAADGKCALSNAAGAELVGSPGEDLIGSSVAESYLPEERHLAMQHVDKLKTAGTLRFEREFLRRNGDVIPVEVSLAALRGRHYQAIVRDISERKRSENALRASEQVARGQVEALTQTLNVLASSPDPENLIGQMLSTMGSLLKAQKVVLWLFDERSDTLVLRLMVEGTEPVAPQPHHPLVKNSFSWRQNLVIRELVSTAAPVICQDVQTAVRINWEGRDYLIKEGTKRLLAVPILVEGRVKGFVVIRHANLATYRTEEIELGQALAHQVMLALQLNELAEQGRRAAVFEERNRLARDIHDTLAQGFTGVIVQLEAAEDAISCDDRTEADDHLRRAAGLARRSLSEARRSVHALRPQVLEEHSFWDALKDIIRNTTVGTPLRTTFATEGKLPELPWAWQENLLRIGQEALTNTLKYAHARNFETRLRCKDSKLRLELRDNGDGFEVADRHDGFGLIGMRERVEQMGGELKVTSSRGKGTKIIVILPCNGSSKS